MVLFTQLNVVSRESKPHTESPDSLTVLDMKTQFTPSNRCFPVSISGNPP